MIIWQPDHHEELGLIGDTLRQAWYWARSRQSGTPVLSVPPHQPLCARAEMEKQLGVPQPDSYQTTITEHWGGVWRSTASRTHIVRLTDLGNMPCSDETAVRRQSLPAMKARTMAAVFKNIFRPPE